MTSSESMLPADARQGSPFAEAPPSRWDWIDAKLSRLSEYVDPILVKETRQALKSRQFLITFCLLLVAGWGFSLIYVAFTFPAIYYAPQGSWVLYGYYVVLCVPMIIIIPFVAFRSLSAEREDGTFDLISITTLRPRQIVAGKLGSAVVQMLIYLSALAPAMAFTYMLRGVDIMVIVMSVFYLFLASVALSVLGLVLATVTTSRQWQMVLGVIYILALVVLFIVALSVGGMGIFEGSVAYDEPLFWALHLFAVTVVAGYTALFYLAAMSRITFASDNRSTKIRTCLVAMQAVALAWASYFWLSEYQDEILIVFFVWAGFHWWLMGALMVGESSDISPRVRRSVPETFIGRAFSIWLYPGAGMGSLLMVARVGGVVALSFALAVGAVVVGVVASAAAVVQASYLGKFLTIAVVLALVVVSSVVTFSLRNHPTGIALLSSFFFAVVAGAAILFLIPVLLAVDPTGDRTALVLDDERVIITAIFFYCYLIIYLGITRIAMMLFNRFVQGGIFLSALLSILIVLFGVFIPKILQWILLALIDRRFVTAGYTVLQVSDPFWTFIATMDHDLTDVGMTQATLPLEGFVLVPAAGFIMFINLILSAREVDRQREEAPDRVLEEDRELHPVKTVETSKSPWDDEDKATPDSGTP